MVIIIIIIINIIIISISITISSSSSSIIISSIMIITPGLRRELPREGFGLPESTSSESESGTSEQSTEQARAIRMAATLERLLHRGMGKHAMAAVRSVLDKQIWKNRPRPWQLWNCRGLSEN